MRIDDVLSNYQQQGSALKTRIKPLRGRRKGPQTAALLFDSVDLATRSDTPDNPLEWLTEYIKRIPTELAVEKTEQSINQYESKVELLVNKLLFYSL
jgi:hypothetical protein